MKFIRFLPSICQPAGVCNALPCVFDAQERVERRNRSISIITISEYHESRHVCLYTKSVHRELDQLCCLYHYNSSRGIRVLLDIRRKALHNILALRAET